MQVERSRRQIGDRRPYFEVGMSWDFEKTQPILSGMSSLTLNVEKTYHMPVGQYKISISERRKVYTNF